MGVVCERHQSAYQKIPDDSYFLGCHCLLATFKIKSWFQWKAKGGLTFEVVSVST